MATPNSTDATSSGEIDKTWELCTKAITELENVEFRENEQQKKIEEAIELVQAALNNTEIGRHGDCPVCGGGVKTTGVFGQSIVCTNCSFGGTTD